MSQINDLPPSSNNPNPMTYSQVLTPAEQAEKGMSPRSKNNSNAVSEESHKNIIRDLGLKVTKQRLVILKALQEGRAHVTAQEVFENISQDHPEIGFATVYRFLRALSENSFLTEVRMGGLPARYEWADKDHHDHLTCVKCGSICEFENKTIEDLQEQICKHFGYVMTDHLLELYGICPVCQINPPADSK